MTDKEFRKIVECELRNDVLGNEVDYLRENVDRWKDTISMLIRDIDQQLLSKKCELLGSTPEERQDYEHWKRKASGYKMVLQNKISEIKRIKFEQNKNILKEEKNTNEKILDQLMLMNELLKIVCAKVTSYEDINPYSRISPVPEVEQVLEQP